MSLPGCSLPSFDSFKGKGPRLEISDYFNGRVEAWGFIQDWKGEVSRRFTVTMQGSWSNGVGTLDEDFVFDDGETTKRIWTLTKKENGHFIGEAADVVGVAKGKQEGNAINMKYVLRVNRTPESTIDLTIDDWLILMDDKRMINISKFYKFGLPVGGLTIYFEKK